MGAIGGAPAGRPRRRRALCHSTPRCCARGERLEARPPVARPQAWGRPARNPLLAAATVSEAVGGAASLLAADLSKLRSKFAAAAQAGQSSQPVAVSLARSAAKVHHQRRVHRARLVAFYRQYNPARVPHVDALLEKYRGREEELLEMMQRKYVGGGGAGVRPAQAAAAAQPAGDARTATIEEGEDRSVSKEGSVDGSDATDGADVADGSDAEDGFYAEEISDAEETSDTAGDHPGAKSETRENGRVCRKQPG